MEETLKHYVQEDELIVEPFGKAHMIRGARPALTNLKKDYETPLCTRTKPLRHSSTPAIIIPPGVDFVRILRFSPETIYKPTISRCPC